VSDAVAARDAVGPAFDRLWATLAPVGSDPSGGYRRLAYTPPELELRDWFAAEARARCLDVHEDRAGNLWAWWGDPTTGDALVTGSHLDSVRRGGAFDGPLGVASGLLAVDLLRARGVVPSRPVAVAAFADEEGARFGVACAGSRLLTGQLDPERALALTDDDGVTYAAALRASGRDPGGLGPDAEVVRSIGAYVELHVEQGRALDDLGAAVGVASTIRAHGRWRFDLAGRADHAGTTRLEDRNDPMLAHARTVLAAREAAAAHGGVATVGRVQVEPNGVNAIPARVRTWLDARADEETRVRAIVADVATAADVAPVEESWTPRTDLDAALRDRLATRLGGAPVLATGAGHDAGILALAGIPTAMLFVRNPTGVSHAPEEHAGRDDCVAGVVALTDVLEDLLTRPDEDADGGEVSGDRHGADGREATDRRARP
jgi:beta-ureidopropionase / N-carbamoyl-L-amino-acid hydrolase